MISIHAPAKGATIYRGAPYWLDAISIHAPAKGATRVNGSTYIKLSISIHAPAKGATGNLDTDQRIFPYFNPRSREGSDCISSFTAHSLADFNPRSREGSDWKL